MIIWSLCSILILKFFLICCSYYMVIFPLPSVASILAATRVFWACVFFFPVLSCSSCVQLFMTLWIVDWPGSFVHGILQTRIRVWLPCPPPGDLPNSGIKPMSPVAPALQGGRFFCHWAIWDWTYDNIASVLCFGSLATRHWDLSSLTRDQTGTSCIGRQSLNHWTAMESQAYVL